MHTRKIITILLTILGLVVLLGGVSTVHVAQKAGVEKAVTMSAPQSPYPGRPQAVPLLATAEGTMEWNRTYGGSRDEVARAVIQTKDSGFVLVGYTASYGAGGRDFWLVKTDAHGEVEWNRTYGGADYDEPYAAIQTADGGFALAGLTQSFGADGNDAWLVKTDARGEVQWNRTYGGTDFAESVIETADGGFVLAGGWGAWLVKTDVHGEVEWKQTFGGECARSAIETADGGFALTGMMTGFPSCDGMCPTDRFWLAKTDGTGVLQWNRTYVDISGEARAVIQTADGGFVLAGGVIAYAEGEEGRWVKTDAQGMVEWTQTYGDFLKSVIETANGEFALVGGAGPGILGTAYLVRTDAYGNVEWTQTYDRTEFYSVIQTADGGFALAGRTKGSRSDFLLVKLPYFPLPDTTPPAITLTSPQNTTYATCRIPVYATNTTEPVHRAWWRYWNGSWSTNQPMTWDGTDGRWEAEGFTWRDESYQVQVYFSDRVGNTAVVSEWFTVEQDTSPPVLTSTPPAIDTTSPAMDTTPPVLSSPADIAYEEGMMGHVITWTVGDRHPGTYDVLSNNSVRVDSGSWTNGTITWRVDGLTPGSYNVTLVVRDAAHNRASDTIWVTVFAAAAPELFAPEDIAVEEGTSGRVITWAVGDRFPGTYAIYTNSEQVDSGSWTNGTIPWNVDGLPQGTYNVTLVVEDAAGNRVSDTVWVTVTAIETPPVPELPVIGTLVLLSLVASTIPYVRRKKSNIK